MSLWMTLWAQLWGWKVTELTGRVVWCLTKLGKRQERSTKEDMCACGCLGTTWLATLWAAVSLQEKFMTNTEDNGQVALSHDPWASGMEGFLTCGLNWGTVSRQSLRTEGWGQAHPSLRQWVCHFAFLNCRGHISACPHFVYLQVNQIKSCHSLHSICISVTRVAIKRYKMCKHIFTKTWKYK